MILIYIVINAYYIRISIYKDIYKLCPSYGYFYEYFDKKYIMYMYLCVVYI